MISRLNFTSVTSLLHQFSSCYAEQDRNGVSSIRLLLLILPVCDGFSVAVAHWREGVCENPQLNYFFK